MARRITISPEFEAHLTKLAEMYVDDYELPRFSLSDACELFHWYMTYCGGLDRAPARIQHLRAQAWQAHIDTCPDGCDTCVEPAPPRHPLNA